MFDTDERRIRFSIVTDDIMRSQALYRDAIGLSMRPFSNAILMFPLGEAEFEVCHRDAARQLVEFEFGQARTSGLLISLRFFSEERMNDSAEKALEVGARLVDQVESKWWKLEDFNGVSWRFTLR
jgi:hypothetical protein